MNRWHPFTLVVLLAWAAPAPAQRPDAGWQIGIALRAEPGTLLSLGVPVVLVRGHLLVEPMLTLDHSSSDIREDSASGTPSLATNQANDQSALRLGIGLYLRKPGAVSVYGGTRGGYGRNWSRTEAQTQSVPFSDIRLERTVSGLWFGALVGVEAALSARFTVGAELHWRHESFDGTQAETRSFGGAPQAGTKNRTETSEQTRGALVARWYP